MPPVIGSIVQTELPGAFPYNHRVELGGDVIHAGAHLVPKFGSSLQILRADAGQQALRSFHQALEFGVVRDIPEFEAIEEFDEL